MPSPGRSANPASGAPSMAPVVLASVRRPVARVASGTTSRSARPVRVKISPERTQTSSISQAASTKVARGAAV